MSRTAAPASPCNDVCRMDEASGWCQGCLRTLDEIAGWSAMDEQQRRSVWASLEARRAQLRAAVAASEATDTPQPKA